MFNNITHYMAEGVMLSKKYDLIGRQFGELLVTERVRINGELKWKCQCSCGNTEVYYSSDQLNSGKKTKCGVCGTKDAHIKHRRSHIGEKHGFLTIVDEIYNYNGTSTKVYICDCDCGNKNVIKHDGYKWHENSSCGCRSKTKHAEVMRKQVDGQKFGRLLVLETLWDETPFKVRCKCDCGNIVVLNKADVQSCHTKSCGCLQRERASETRYVDSSGYVSPLGLKIIKPYQRDAKGRMLWECECGLCHSHFYGLPALIKSGKLQSCGCGNMSHREILVEKILKDNKVNFKTQYTFPDCKKNNVLRFDFAVFDNENNLVAMIETDGMQHYKPIDYFGGENGFKLTCERDNIKNNYCKSHGINLIRLPYYLSDDEVKTILLNIKLA